jgi:MYXO-CTERM domain-containing protein
VWSSTRSTARFRRARRFRITNVRETFGGGPGADSFFDVFVDVELPGSEPLNPNLPLVQMTMTGQGQNAATVVPEPGAAVLVLLGVVGLRRRRR